MHVLTRLTCTRCRYSVFSTLPQEVWLQPGVRRYTAKSSRPSSIDNLVGVIRKNTRDTEQRRTSRRFPDQQNRTQWTDRQNSVTRSRSPYPPKSEGGLPFWLGRTEKDRAPPESLTPTRRPYQKPEINPDNVVEFFQSEVQRWANLSRVRQRLEDFGIPQHVIPILLSAFVREVQSGELSTPSATQKYNLERFAQVTPPTIASQIDIICSTIFYQWASDPQNEPRLISLVRQPSIIDGIRRLAQAADRSHPPEEYPKARRMHRKVIMHVGPTNSGKTHHALRALAASKCGVYAGPLRLLAHEIWERLNLGEIVPLGVEEKPVTPYTSSPASKASQSPPTAPAQTPTPLLNLKHVRQCNMVTGEEQKIVAEDAPLLSCTVEMLLLGKPYDVAVVDEIQMIADDQRGFAWTNAVLGLCAQELHLCGEETAVPIVEALLKDTGDELIVNRYERLTPLIVEQASLDGDWSKIKPGDCIVTFSRANIFGIKKQVEEKTGMRCAVVYGKLPPEIRSEQAALFNDPNSGYDVLVGSDAIGMGLNLKIRRIIFESVRKFGDGCQMPLSVSQVKQIAGRAGRYGLHGSSDPAGYVTTFHANDLPFIQTTIGAQVSPLRQATLGFALSTVSRIAGALPPESSLKTIHQAHIYASTLDPAYKYSAFGVGKSAIDFSSRNGVITGLEQLCRFVDQKGGDLPMRDRLQLLNAPVSWRDPLSIQVVADFILQYNRNIHVSLMKALGKTHLMNKLMSLEDRMKAGKAPASKPKAKSTGRALVPLPVTSADLWELEVLHKILVFYVWMSFRNPVAYSDYELVTDLKLRTEVALEWCLREIGYKKSDEAPSKQKEESQKQKQKNQEKKGQEKKLMPMMEEQEEQSRLGYLGRTVMKKRGIEYVNGRSKGMMMMSASAPALLSHDPVEGGSVQKVVAAVAADT